MQKEMQHKITRLLYELNALNKGKICLVDMCADLGVSLRTLQRDMRDMQDADFPLYCPQPGEYAFIEGFSLEKMKLSDKEASLLIIMHEMAASLGEHFNTSYNLLKQRLLGTTQESPFFVKFAGGETFPDTPVIREIARCIRSKEKIKICYKGGRRTYYQLRPLKLLWVEGFWYLLALTDTDKLLKFRLEKITEATALDKFFQYNADIEQIIRQGTNIWFEKERPLYVKMTVSPQAAKYFEKRNYFPLQKVEKKLPGGGLLISCQAVTVQEIIPMILHWLPEIKVKEPQALAQQIKGILQSYLREI